MLDARSVHRGLNYESGLKREAGLNLKAIDNGPGEVSPFLIGRTFASPNIVRSIRRTLLRFLIEFIVRRTWFGQFDELYFVLNWLIMTCKFRPEPAAEAQQTA